MLCAGKTYIGIKLVLSILANTQTLAPASKALPAAAAAGQPAGAQGANLQNPPDLPPDAELAAASKKPVIGPILVICFTNHALNQFLEGLLAAGITEGLVRVGGFEKSEKLKASQPHFCGAGMHRQRFREHV